MSERLNHLAQTIQNVLGARVKSIEVALNEVTLVVSADDYLNAAFLLRDEPALAFAQLIDLCGVDYQEYGDGTWTGLRFAVVTHLLSLQHNQRLRLRVFAPDDSYPVVASLVPVWSSANWFEREAFDLFGILFDGHEDLRRILTDYGFIGHPFRKDFPISGTVEMRYDPELKRVVYQPVTIEPREVIPRIVREESYGGPA
ncbi:NADH-quinone oxidoreductase subunit C [Polynucleobacter sp. IMCC 29146]|jgi:NADH-quinone oxidoreductase subunit C|uniref:NADH-quinone oxidoreductase subunit C n=1 Tax=Polynucleobacter sp. IMCC 29146 TaxID=2780953 RepID=UPI001F35B987|nr:NADH-quinone oxidoreductase subunit C [Polynucleobacter sp. IMCC 29146]MCE7529274.1 NADH-quinone oxidoreductase subunit C [Polynucleobacter sp. IMCC 29146]MCX7245581.1 NADH-quinone oxidoreductase subunit C [Burkholderiales bacterium]